MINTVAFLGENNFSLVTQEFNLTAEEIEALRNILKTWDDSMGVIDFSERNKKKMEAAAKIIVKFSSERRRLILGALMKINLLLSNKIRRHKND